MSKLAFTLIELIVVVVLIGIFIFLVIPREVKYVKILSPSDFYDFLYPNGKMIVFKDGTNLVIFPDKNLTNVNINLNFSEVYVYENGMFKRKYFDNVDDKEVVFEYSVKRGIGDSFILSGNDKFFVFKPFWIYTLDSFEEAKDKYLLKSGD